MNDSDPDISSKSSSTRLVESSPRMPLSGRDILARQGGAGGSAAAGEGEQAGISGTDVGVAGGGDTAASRTGSSPSVDPAAVSGAAEPRTW